MCEGRKELSLKPQSKWLQKNVNCVDCLYVLEAQSFWYERLLNIWHLHISLHSFIFIFTRCTPCSLSRPSRHHATCFQTWSFFCLECHPFPFLVNSFFSMTLLLGITLKGKANLRKHNRPDNVLF